jgi:hypothetical protein
VTVADLTTREVEGHRIITSGSLVCPSFDLCDVRDNETYEAYVERHAYDHHIDLSFGADAERNLGLNCFYFDHKYIYGNVTLIPQPFWEMHAFIAEDEWNEDDLEERVPIRSKTFARVPDAAMRRPGDVRSMKQVEVPRQCEKTSVGAEAYSIFISKREYFVNDTRNYPIMIRSETALNARDSLQTLRLRATRRPKIRELYGVTLIKCDKCSVRSQIPQTATRCCPACGETKKIRVSKISLIDPTVGSGGTGKDSITFRWATDGQNIDPDDEDAIYSVRAVGLSTRMTGQRPRRYILDDIQTEDNSDTHEKRIKIQKKFDEAVRQVEFGGSVLLLNTRKFTEDFAAKVSVEPLRSEFHTLHRRVRWPTDEPDAPPYVVGGMRYYYPIKGDGERALDERQVDRLERMTIERSFSAEYLNDPTDEKRATFKRAHFPIIPRESAPPEIRYGLGQEVSAAEQMELDHLNVRIFALNSCDPAAIEQQKKLGDDNFIVGIRLDRHARIFITRLAAGKWASTRLWDEIYAANNYNHPQFNDYEMPASEIHIRDSYMKWAREKSEALSAVNEEPVVVSMPMKWSHMPKSTKRSRIDSMESYVPLYILDDAADKALIEKFIGQWLGLGVADHDDGPDATSRLIRWLGGNRYKEPEKSKEDQWIDPDDGAAYVTLAALKQMAIRPPEQKLWGEGGR